LKHIGTYGSEINAQLVEKQMRLWQVKRQIGNKNNGAQSWFRFLTVSKDEGSLGTEIIQDLSKRLGWHIFDEEIIGYIAENNHISERMVRQLDQRSESNIQNMVERFLKTIESNSFGGDDYFESLLLTLMYLARQGSAIFVDRGANFALLNESHGLRIRVTASREVRIGRFSERWKVSREEASQRLHDIDEEKKKFVRHYYWHEIDDTQFYDAIFNTDRTSARQVASSIFSLMIGPAREREKIRRTLHPDNEVCRKSGNKLEPRRHASYKR
jgi:hypothetical protein